MNPEPRTVNPAPRGASRELLNDLYANAVAVTLAVSVIGIVLLGSAFIATWVLKLFGGLP